jgi:hypothetical protein
LIKEETACSSERLAALCQSAWPRSTERNKPSLYVTHYKSFNYSHLQKQLSDARPVAFVAFCKQSQNSNRVIGRTGFVVTRYDENCFPTVYRLEKLHSSFREVPVYVWHKRNLARITGEGEEQNRQWVLGTLRSGQVRRRGKTDLKQPLIYITPLSPTHPNFSYLPLFNSEAKRLFLDR